MPPQEIIVVDRGGGKLPLLIASLGGIAAAIWWFFNRGSGGGKGSAGGNLQLRLSLDGLTMDGNPITPDMAAGMAKERGVGADVTVTGDAKQGDLDILRVTFGNHGIPLSVAQGVVVSGGFYRLGNS